jgi:hypothetical protein
VSLSDGAPTLRFSRTTIYPRGRCLEWARVASPQGGVARGGPAPPGGVAPAAPLASSFWLPSSSSNI